MVRTAGFHPANRSSILRGVTKERASSSTREASKLTNKSKSEMTCFCCSKAQQICYTCCMEDEAKKLGKNLKEIRLSKGIKQIALAKSLNVDRSFVSNIENGKTNPTLSTISSLAKALGVSTNELLK